MDKFMEKRMNRWIESYGMNYGLYMLWIGIYEQIYYIYIKQETRNGEKLEA